MSITPRRKAAGDGIGVIVHREGWRNDAESRLTNPSQPYQGIGYVWLRWAPGAEQRRSNYWTRIAPPPR